MSTVVTLIAIAGFMLILPIALLVVAIVLVVNFGRKKS